MITIRRAEERGPANHGWLDSYHTFSFADYYDPAHMGFRSLRVINEDRVQAARGFDTHSHRDFEIISYIVSGALKHEDSMGHTAVMRAGDVQRISAGTGIEHSEYNHSSTQPVHFLQIWLVPSRNGLPPNYAQESFAQTVQRPLTLACSADGRAGSIEINQDADVFIGRLQPSEQTRHPLRDRRHAWVQLIEGDLHLNDEALSAGDGAALTGEREVRLASSVGAHLLLFDLM
jgi:redox-sensitive bicupin YhaK (pirin superfamily)